METCWTPADRERVLAEVEEELWRYVARHALAVPVVTRLLADLTGLPPESLDTLRHLHLLLSDDVAAFVDAALPELLRLLRPVAPPEPVTGRSAVRGRIAWGETMAARARHGGSDRAMFVAATPLQRYATAETRLLVRTLDGLAHSCRALRGVAAGPALEQGWTVQLQCMETAIARARAHHRLGAVDVAATVAAVDLAACARSPREATRAMAAAYRRYRDLVAQPALPALVEALGQRALAPLDDDTLYEVWTLLGAAAEFDDAGWTLEAAALAGQAAVPFTYRAPNRRSVARLYFGHTPERWRRGSRYRAVFDYYGLAGAVRRPDLIVEVQRGATRRYLLVEVKRTRDPQYIADSIYKVLGYLADFDSAFAGQDGPRALLVLWDGLGAGGPDVAPETIVLATHHDYRARLRALITGGAW